MPFGPTSNSGSTFGSLGGIPSNNVALAEALAAKLDKVGGTMTGALAVTPSAANAIACQINGAVTGGGVTRSLIKLADDWSGATGGTSAPTLLEATISDTGGVLNYGATSFLNFKRNGVSVMRVDHGGGIAFGTSIFIDTNNLKVQVPSNGYFSLAGDMILARNSPNSLQLGLIHATTPTAQTIGAHPVTTGTGASLTLQGGNGSVARGNVVLLGGNRAAYDAAPSTAVIRDILISHGLMAAS